MKNKNRTTTTSSLTSKNKGRLFKWGAGGVVATAVLGGALSSSEMTIPVDPQVAVFGDIELVIAPEVDAPYDRDEWGFSSTLRNEYVDSKESGDTDLWYSLWDGDMVTRNQIHLDHIVAMSEGNQSGGYDWTIAEKNIFANDPENWIVSSASANIRKSDKDAAQWVPSNDAATCFWVVTTIQVKNKYVLAVDEAEAKALKNLWDGLGCE